MSRRMRYAYLDCEDAPKWAGHEAIAFSLLHPGAAWAHYRCWAGELPPLDSLATLDGVLISGSHYSAYEEHPWIAALRAWLREAVARYPDVRFVAMCFGCQVLADALGGSAGKNPDGGFVLKVERLALAPQLASSPALRLAAQDGSSGGSSSGSGAGNGSSGAPMRSLCLLQSHGDAVLRLPPGAVALASSPTAAVEMWTNSGGNVLAVQGHAELSREDMLGKILPAIAAAGRLTPAEAEESRRRLTDDAHDGMLVRLLFRRFMEGHSLGVGPAAAAAAAATDAGPAAAAAAAEQGS